MVLRKLANSQQGSPGQTSRFEGGQEGNSYRPRCTAKNQQELLLTLVVRTCATSLSDILEGLATRYWQSHPIKDGLSYLEVRGSSKKQRALRTVDGGGGACCWDQVRDAVTEFFSGASKEARRENVAGLSGGGCFGQEGKKEEEEVKGSVDGEE